jgi:hypothetical protein
VTRRPLGEGPVSGLPGAPARIIGPFPAVTWNRPPDDLTEWLGFHPGAEVHPDGPLYWLGSYPLGSSKLTCGPVARADLMDAMVELAASAGACLRVEADWPGWLAWVTPDGRWTAHREHGDQVLTASGGDPGGLRAAIAGQEADAVKVIPGSAYKAGPGAGTRAHLRNSYHYPVTAVCGPCSGVVSRLSIHDGWRHTGRLAGEAPAVVAPRPGGTATAGPDDDDDNYCGLCRRPLSACKCS